MSGSSACIVGRRVADPIYDVSSKLVLHAAKLMVGGVCLDAHHRRSRDYQRTIAGPGEPLSGSRHRPRPKGTGGGDWQERARGAADRIPAQGLYILA